MISEIYNIFFEFQLLASVNFVLLTRNVEEDFPIFETEEFSEVYNHYYSTMLKIDKHFVEFINHFEEIGRGE